MKYESSPYSSSRVIGKVKVFVHAHPDAGDTIAPDIRPGELKNNFIFVK